MRFGSFLSSFLLIACVYANTEKLIFKVGPEASCVDINITNATRLIPPFSTMQHEITPFNDAWLDPSPPMQRWYHLDQLELGMSYELRISYPATLPTDFQLTLYTPCHEANNVAPSRYVLVKGYYAGVSRQPGRDRAPVTYDIVLENLYAGFLFYQVYKIVVAIVAVLGVGLFVILPFVRTTIQNVIHASTVSASIKDE